MPEKLLADLIMVAHAGWVLFVLLGFLWTLAAFFIHRRFFGWFWFRTVHLAGIASAALLPLLGLYCPLTALEFDLRLDAGTSAAGGFIVHYLQKWGNQDLAALIIYSLQGITLAMFLATLAAYIFRPPERVRSFFRRGLGSLNVRRLQDMAGESLPFKAKR